MRYKIKKKKQEEKEKRKKLWRGKLSISIGKKISLFVTFKNFMVFESNGKVRVRKTYNVIDLKNN